ncbi:MAG: ATP-grasp domain-containing protein [Pirellulales bacterium]
MQVDATPYRCVVLYEYTCSGGLLAVEHLRNAASLMREGWAMLRALAADLAAIPGVQVQVLADYRGLPGPLPGCELVPVHTVDEERSALSCWAAESDWTVLIAPEFHGILRDRCSVVEVNGGRLLGPSSGLVALLSDKQRTVEHLERHDVPTPRGLLWRPGDSLNSPLPCPVVIKPNDGAGSQETYVCRDSSHVHGTLAGSRRPARIESFVEGLPASVAFFCGPAGCTPLPACSQRLQVDRRISYIGGAMPLPSALNERATMIASRAIGSLRQPLGYVGVDVVLGNDVDGSEDCVIEINPRFTTSYVGLRAAARTNLAAAMLDVAEGRRPGLSFGGEAIEFDADGTVRRSLECAASSPLSFSNDVFKQLNAFVLSGRIRNPKR